MPCRGRGTAQGRGSTSPPAPPSSRRRPSRTPPSTPSSGAAASTSTGQIRRARKHGRLKPENDGSAGRRRRGCSDLGVVVDAISLGAVVLDVHDVPRAGGRGREEHDNDESQPHLHYVLRRASLALTDALFRGRGINPQPTTTRPISSRPRGRQIDPAISAPFCPSACLRRSSRSSSLLFDSLATSTQVYCPSQAQRQQRVPPPIRSRD